MFLNDLLLIRHPHHHRHFRCLLHLMVGSNHQYTCYLLLLHLTLLLSFLSFRDYPHQFIHPWYLQLSASYHLYLSYLLYLMIAGYYLFLLYFIPLYYPLRLLFFLLYLHNPFQQSLISHSLYHYPQPFYHLLCDL